MTRTLVLMHVLWALLRFVTWQDCHVNLGQSRNDLHGSCRSSWEIWIFLISAACSFLRLAETASSSEVFFIFYNLQLFLAVAVGRPIPHSAHLRDRSTGSIAATLTRCDPPSGCFHGPFHPHTALPVHNSPL